MPTANQILVHSLIVAKGMLARFTADLMPAEYLHRSCDGANCTAWIIGHLILSERGALKRLGFTPEQMPALPEGFETRYARDETAPKSASYGDVSGLMELFNAHRDLFISAVRALPPEKLDGTLEKPHPMFATIWEYITFMGAIHLTMHAGQITMIRRSMGKPPIV